MFRYAALGVVASIVLLVSTADGQVVVRSPVVTSYYAPAVAPVPAVSYYGSSYSFAPAASYRVPAVSTLPPITTYYGPSTVTSYYSPAPFTTYYSAPVASYYAPAATYYAPASSYYAPTTAYYGGAVVTPVIGSPVVAGRSAYGTVRAYVPGQPIRNALRYTVP